MTSKLIEVVKKLDENFEFSVRRNNTGFKSVIDGSATNILFAFYYLKEFIDNDDDFKFDDETMSIIKEMAQDLYKRGEKN